MLEIFSIPDGMKTPATDGSGLKQLGGFHLEEFEWLHKFEIMDQEKISFFEDTRFRSGETSKLLEHVKNREAVLTVTPGFKSPPLTKLKLILETAVTDNHGLLALCD